MGQAQSQAASQAQTELITQLRATIETQSAHIARQDHELRGLRRAQGQHLYRH